MVGNVFEDIPGPLTETELERVLGRLDDPPTDVRFREGRSLTRYVAKGDGEEVVVIVEEVRKSRKLKSQVKGLMGRDGDDDLTPEKLRRFEQGTELVADHTEVPVPEVLDADFRPDDVSHPFLLVRRNEGETFNDDAMTRLEEDTAERLVAEAGANLARIHGIQSFDGFGETTVEDGRLVADEADDWPTYFREVTEERLDLLGDDIFRDMVPAICEYVEDALPCLDDEYETALGAEYRLGHLLVDEGGDPVTANVGGWEQSSVVHREYNLVETEEHLVNRRFAEADQRDRLRERLYDEYEAQYPDLRGDGFEERRDLYRLSARLYAMVALPIWLGDAPDSILESRADEYREFVRGIIDG